MFSIHSWPGRAWKTASATLRPLDTAAPTRHSSPMSASPPAAPRPRRWFSLALLGALLLLSLPFAWHSLRFGLEGMGPVAPAGTHLHQSGAWLSNPLMFVHMISGAVLTLLAPLQLLTGLRRRWPRLHRACGRLLAGLAVLTALAGLGYIGLRGTVGGVWMDVAFAGYGLCLLVAALQVVRMARAGDLQRHRAWALRFFVLAIGSLLYRLHYGLWYLATGGLASEADFSGLFDRLTLFAFYLPYLLAVELWLRRRRGRGPAAGR